MSKQLKQCEILLISYVLSFFWLGLLWWYIHYIWNRYMNGAMICRKKGFIGNSWKKSNKGKEQYQHWHIWRSLPKRLHPIVTANDVYKKHLSFSRSLQENLCWRDDKKLHDSSRIKKGWRLIFSDVRHFQVFGKLL